MTKLKLNIPDRDDVISEANRKGLTAYKIHKLTGLSREVTYRYFKGGRVSRRTEELIIETINNYK